MCELPAVILTGIRPPGIGETCTGTELNNEDEYAADPSCLEVLSPQHQIVLSLAMAQVCWSPAAMRLVASVEEMARDVETVALSIKTIARHATKKETHNELWRRSWHARSPRNFLPIMGSI